LVFALLGELFDAELDQLVDLQVVVRQGHDGELQALVVIYVAEYLFLLELGAVGFDAVLKGGAANAQ
jgi:hypothetical protein